MFYFQKMGLGISFIFIALISSCSVFSPIKSSSNTTYELTTIPKISIKKSAHPKTILVMQTEASSTYNSPQMVYTNKPYQTNYFSKNSWGTSPAYMIQQLIIETLQTTGHFRAVVSPSFIGNYDYVLNTQLIELQQDFSHNPSVIHLVLRAQITQFPSNKIIATKQFSIQRPTPVNTPYGGVIAANEATGILLQELAAFCLKNS